MDGPGVLILWRASVIFHVRQSPDRYMQGLEEAYSGMIGMKIAIYVAAMLALLLPGANALAQDAAPAGQPSSNGVDDTLKTGGKIVAQPAHDVGAAKTKIPPVLEAAHDNPYSLRGVNGCAQINGAIRELNEALGPDFGTGPARKENRAGKLAEAGGKTVINAIIPFRGLVREISGAAPEQRRLNDAIDAGFARRGFLRGVASSRKCRI